MGNFKNISEQNNVQLNQGDLDIHPVQAYLFGSNHSNEFVLKVRTAELRTTSYAFGKFDIFRHAVFDTRSLRRILPKTFAKLTLKAEFVACLYINI